MTDNHGCSDNSKFRVRYYEEFAVLQTKIWRIRGIVPCANLVVVYGAPGCGKTFAVLDMVMSVARSIPEWCGHRVTGGRVTYICAESAHGFKNRLIAYAKYNGLNAEDFSNFGIIPESPDFFLTPKNTAELAAQIGKSDIVVIDTLAAAMTGGDENTGRDMGKVINECKRLSELTTATIILVHHTGKQAENGARGWSGLLGATDAEIFIEKIGNQRTLTVTKQKDGETASQVAFSLIPLEIGLDEYGDSITSCYFNLSDAITLAPTQEKPLGDLQKIIMACFDFFIEKPVQMDDLMEEILKHIPRGIAKEDERRKRIFKSIEGLCAKKKLSVFNDKVYNP